VVPTEETRRDHTVVLTCGDAGRYAAPLAYGTPGLGSTSVAEINPTVHT
jgi:hypothetical protein